MSKFSIDSMMDDGRVREDWNIDTLIVDFSILNLGREL